MGQPETETLGRYVVVRRSGRRDAVPGGAPRAAGEGPLAHVRAYLVRTRDGEDRQLCQLYLLDPVPQSLATVRRGVERYRALRHPALSPLVDCFEHEGHLALVFGREEGVGLDRLKGYVDRDRERLPDAAVWFLGWQVAGALAVGHLARDDAGALAPMVHGALTMQDVLVAWNGAVRLQGLCPHLGSPPGGGSSPEAAPSRVWLAPEVRRGEAPTPRSDVYALALILRALLSGRAPAAAGERIAELRPDIPGDVAEALDRALYEPEPLARPSAAELSQRLEGLVRVTEGRRALSDCMELYQALWGLWSVASPEHGSHTEPNEGTEGGEERHTYPGPEPQMSAPPPAPSAPRADEASVGDDPSGQPALAADDAPAAEQRVLERGAGPGGAGVENDEEEEGPRTSRSPGTDAPPTSAPEPEVGVAEVESLEAAEGEPSEGEEAGGGAEAGRAAGDARAVARREPGERRPRQPEPRLAARGSASRPPAERKEAGHGWLIAAVAVVVALLVWYVLGDGDGRPGDDPPAASAVASTLASTVASTATAVPRPPTTPASAASTPPRAPSASATAPGASSSAPAAPAVVADVADPTLRYDEALLRVDSEVKAVVFVNGVAVGPTNQDNKVWCGQRFVRLGAELGSWVNDGRSVPLPCGKLTRVRMDPGSR